jgi:hypothetical protein
MRKISVVGGTAVLVGVVLAPCAPAGAVSPQGKYCDPSTTRSYSGGSISWYLYDGGTMVDNSSGTISKAFQHTVTGSATTTVSAEVGVKASTVVAEVNTELGISASVSASISTRQTFTVSAPPHSKIDDRDGIARRASTVTTTQILTNCQT